ncbi:hypothetical protein FJT64_011613 [Amphibalanus amphitrite]|uniref:Uncharacterized protein n=1 Tax=Amphibalanus amphitrite TaxID=1232801 RepID=A0A6A4V928_AMPAM|nr:hypothetical protein FJT64_011613 [Amphibalanus amphitrite]
MSYEEWLVDVRRVESLCQQSAAAAAASVAASSRPPPQKGSVEIVLSHRGRRRRQQWPRPAPQNAVTKPLRVQMLKVHLRQKMMPAIMEVPAQQMEWSDDDDDINVIV